MLIYLSIKTENVFSFMSLWASLLVPPPRVKVFAGSYATGYNSCQISIEVGLHLIPQLGINGNQLESLKPLKFWYFPESLWENDSPMKKLMIQMGTITKHNSDLIVIHP